MLNQDKIRDLGDALFVALRDRTMIDPLTEREPEISIEDAYQISLRLLERRVADGETIIGKKIGVTSTAVQRMLDVHQPDFGYLTDRMLYADADEVPISKQLMQPRAEGEIAFVLKRDLMGPGVTNAQVLAATELVLPCFEIVDSRIRDWKIRIQDTVADNASCGLFVLGSQGVDPRRVDLTTCGMVVEKNGQILSTGAGAACLDSPVNAVAWLANTLGRVGVALKAGEVILSGSLVPLEPVQAGDYMSVEIGGIGSASVRFA
ncbi:2-oxopent-4-enoate hydratase [Thiohalocapsa marina]|uniref:2-oxopent-4-enoate hydratase n=1 Tax=Thiohalocapsa marina TaxID=424902 RepID=A0A5M8FQG9_9GAMM|nr:2-oxopent-4-enoate hydratase [Thiohalocapsa marina]KAA6183182.1 2-oxopent-4-enoate hydratase [Thiohalocapsa marina]